MRWLWVLLVPSVAFADRVCTHGAKRCLVQVEVDAHGRRVMRDVPDGLGAPDLAAAYAIPVATDTGATVALVEAYGYPLLESDLAIYRSAFALPPCSIASGCLTVVNQRGQITPLPSTPRPESDDWTLETALDLDMVSAGCPTCRILVVEADSEDNDNLEIANDVAASLGATTISNSWAGPEDATANAHFAHPGIATFASTGDHGDRAVASYPASAPAVIAVGGTLLQGSNSLARGWVETAWSSGGSGCSAITPRPAWQPASACAMRHVPDISAVADGPRGIAIANRGKWSSVTGTSAASPLVAAIYALTQHGSAAAPYAYAHPELFFDIEDGSNGTCDACSAGAGWDGPTGVGSPNAAAMGGATPPTLALDPPDGGMVNEGFAITATCTPTDGSEVTRVALSVDAKLLPPMTHPPYTMQPDPDLFPAGTHYISANCATSSLMTARTVSIVRVCVRDGVCPDPPHTLPDGGCTTGGTAPAWILLVLRARRRRSRARG